nr:hypothetical protein [Micromonospora sp. DSM 115978]
MRRIGMSSDALFVIVEGRDSDRLFYGEMCESSIALRTAGYQIWIVEQTQRGGSGGKDAVLAFYAECRAGRRLRIDMGAGVKRLAFCVDNDADEVLGKAVRSPNVVYTYMHDVEAEILSRGDAERAISVALGLDRRTAAMVARSIQNWIRDMADLWVDWIELCLLAKASRSRCSVGYGTPSTINPGLVGRAIPRQRDSLRVEVESKSLLSRPEFLQIERELKSTVVKLRARAEMHRLVKGRWMRQYLAVRLRGALQDFEIRARTNGIEQRLVSSYAAFLDIDADESKYFREKLERLLR